MDGVRTRHSVGVGLLATAIAAGALVSGAEPPERQAGWAELSRVGPGTAIVVSLTDGRHLERHMVATTGETLITLDLSSIASRDGRNQVLSLLRQTPQRYLADGYVEDGGKRFLVVQRFDRASILAVARPRPLVLTMPAPLRWMLSYAGPCPNCDPAQTAFGGRTPLPSPLPRRMRAGPLMGEAIYLAPTSTTPNPLDLLSWERTRLLLPASLQGK